MSYPAWAENTDYVATNPASFVTFADRDWVCTQSHRSADYFDFNFWTPAASSASLPPLDEGTIVRYLRGAEGPPGKPSYAIPTDWQPNTQWQSDAPASVVRYQGGSYVCAVSHLSTSFFDAAKWSLLVPPASGDLSSLLGGGLTLDAGVI